MDSDERDGREGHAAQAEHDVREGQRGQQQVDGGAHGRPLVHDDADHRVAEEAHHDRQHHEDRQGHPERGGRGGRPGVPLVTPVGRQVREGLHGRLVTGHRGGGPGGEAGRG